MSQIDLLEHSFYLIHFHPSGGHHCSSPLILHTMKAAVLVLLLCLAAAQAAPQSELPPAFSAS